MLSYQILEKRLDFNRTLPVTEKWSAAADFLSIISDYCLQKKPQTIVECSSGTSSLVLSQCCKLNQYGHVYSLENSEEFAGQSRRQLNDFSLSSCCDVLYAPLKTVVLSDVKYQWYDAGKLPENAIDLLVIDGPPGFIQKYSRYPALPVLNRLLAKHCAVFLDDAAREDEQEIVRQWSRDYPEFQVDYIDNERGCFVLSR